MVCECNSTYCDSVGSATLPPVGQFSSYLSSRAGSRLEPTQGQVQANSTGTGERCWDVVGRCCSEQLHSIFYCLYIFFSSRPPFDYRPRPEVPEDQGIRRSYDRCSSHQHPVSFCWCSRPVASAVLFSRRYTKRHRKAAELRIGIV